MFINLGLIEKLLRCTEFQNSKAGGVGTNLLRIRQHDGGFSVLTLLSGSAQRADNSAIAGTSHGRSLLNGVLACRINEDFSNVESVNKVGDGKVSCVDPPARMRGVVQRGIAMAG